MHASNDDSHPVTWTIEEALSLAETSMEVEPFRGESQVARFEIADPGVDLDVDLVLSDPRLDHGTIHWVPEARLSAMTLAKVLRAEGHTAHLLWDMAEHENGTLWGWAVVTDRPMEHSRRWRVKPVQD